MSYYLEDYLDRMESLPYELQQNFIYMKQKDERFEELREKVSAKYHAYWKGTKRGPGPKTTTNGEDPDVLMQAIKDDTRQATEIIDDKLTVANQTFDMLDQHIKHLDGEIKKFEETLEAQGIFPAAVTPVISHPTSEILEEEGSLDTSFSGASSLIKSPTLATLRKKGIAMADLGSNLGSPLLSIGRRRRRPKSAAPFSPADLDATSEGFTGEEERMALSDTDSTEAETYGMGTPERPDITRISEGPGENGEDPLYCLCRQVSYGDMIACDNPNVSPK
jgi:inhibitor of growth protein 4